ncbi:OsmC family protein [Pseudoalteromonas luteoviolacea]|uniref:OsmC family protein n=1 Tax=Pseudoalteromonas luteoviolacea TaxID=43657 RepID=UPI001153E7F5|nr:OsmC family protein [Pseudoalteromonas luteoviolacea]TQF67968.1 OsmC family peroxiredoxin [Pseudoalteromonas luteoviolacea]
MAKYTAEIAWQRTPNEKFVDQKYSRAHTWTFDGGVTVAASSSPTIVPLPYSNADNVDPEEAFVASLSSCHMLFFLHFAAKAGLIVDSYTDTAQGIMANNQQGKLAMAQIVLKPSVTWQNQITIELSTLESLHHQAHEACFLANSVHSQIIIEPQQLKS